MATSLPSNAEVENLLHAMETASGHRRPGSQPGRTREKVTTYDFKRPERVGKEQMRALQTLHEGFGRNFGATLSTMVRTVLEVKLTSVDQLTYGEFVFSLENPTCFNLIRAEPLEGNLILDINPSILYPIIDRLLGGGREGGPIQRRPLTEIELRLVSKITDLFLEQLKTSWENVIQLDLSVVRVESNPHLVQICPPNEVVVLISFELMLGETRGMMNLCVPFNSIEHLTSKFAADTWSSYTKREATPSMIANLQQSVRAALVELTATLAETSITAQELFDLRVNDIITTSKDVNAPLAINVHNVTKFMASPGVFKGQKAVRIEGLAENDTPPETKKA